MEKERKVKTLSLVALIVAVLGLTVAFAALSQTLTISGTASVNAAEWDIHFENLEKVALGDATNAEPTLSGTTISGINVTLTKPGDMGSFQFDIVNNGTIDAKIASIDVSKLCTLQSPVESCDWNNDGAVTQEDIDKINDNVSFALFYYDEKINDGNLSEIKIDDVIKAGETNTVNMTLAYSKIDLSGSEPSLSEATELPERNLTFNDLSVTINYVQAD